MPWPFLGRTTAPAPVSSTTPLSGSPPVVIGTSAPAGDLDIRAQIPDVLAGVWTLIVNGHTRRRWLVVQNLATSDDVAVIAPSLGPPVFKDGLAQYGLIELSPGDVAIFSQTGDMPWLGSIYAQALTVGHTVHLAWTEAQDYPAQT